MVKFTDVLILLLQAVASVVMLFLLVFVIGYPFLIFPWGILMMVLHYAIKRKKKILKYVKEDYEDLGFELIDEKPVPFSANDIKFNVTPVKVNGLPLSRYGYVRKFHRVFTARHQDGQLFELTTVNTKTWDGDNEVEITELRALDDYQDNDNL